MAVLVALIYVCLVVAVSLLLRWQTRKPKGFPPGPPRLPIVGSLPFITARSRPSEPPTAMWGMKKLVDKYGPVVGFYMGRQPTVFLADMATIKEVAKMDGTEDRPKHEPVNEGRIGWEVVNGTENEGSAPGVAFVSGKDWREQRRFALRHLRDCGFGRAQMEGIVLDEVEKLVASFSRSTGKPVCVSNSFYLSVVNSLMMLVFGNTFDLDNPKAMDSFQRLQQQLRNSSGVINPPVLAKVLPSPQMLKLPVLRQLSGIDKIHRVWLSASEALDPWFRNHRDNFDPESLNDYFDQVLSEIEHTTDPASSFYGEKGHSFARNAVIDMFFAGSETTASSLQYAILYMLHHPDVMRRVQREIDDVCGEESSSHLSDRPNMHYTNAVLQEALRMSGMFWITQHRNRKEIRVGAYTIPKDTTIFNGLLMAMRDPKLFEEPNRFNPDRFISPQDGKFIRCDSVVPFGVGKRQCLGMALAEMEFFLFFTSILRKFDLNPSPLDPLPSYEWDVNTVKSGLRLAPLYKCIITERTR